LRSAHSATQAAREVLAGATSCYGLARPPGHHAFSEIAGGFCYFNNSAIAAQTLLEDHDRVAIMDVDLHHGNGTQGIFYDRDDVLTVSIHADPRNFYPFFWGGDTERGRDAGQGCNLNLPLDLKTGDDGFLKAMDRAMDKIEGFAPGAIVVALGLDASEHDPFGGLSLTTQGFAAVAAMIAQLGKPTVMIQEGGYISPVLGRNLSSFLEGFMAHHRL
jgi:acetoin utilization deacetylase AcuC-like enzyme